MSVIARLTRDWNVTYTESGLEFSIIWLPGAQLAKTTSENWLIVGISATGLAVFQMHHACHVEMSVTSKQEIALKN